MMGFPGSGKTHFSEKLSKDFNFFHLNSDWLRGYITDPPTFAPEEHRRVFTLMHALTEKLLATKTSVIFDANTTKEVQRKHLEKIAKKYKATFSIIWIQTELETAKKRVKHRSTYTHPEKKRLYKNLSEDVIHHLKDEIEAPKAKHNLLIIDGHKSYQSQKSIIEKFLIKNSV